MNVWADIKRYRQQWLKKEKSNAPSKCVDAMVDSIIIEEYLTEQENKYKLTGLFTSRPIYKTKITVDNL